MEQWRTKVEVEDNKIKNIMVNINEEATKMMKRNRIRIEEAILKISFLNVTSWRRTRGKYWNT